MTAFNKNIAINSKNRQLLQDIQKVWVNHIDDAIIVDNLDKTSTLFVTIHEDWVVDGFHLIPHCTVETYPNAKKLHAQNRKKIQNMELIVFTNNGQTFIFKQVSNFAHTSTGFTFEYTGESTGVTRKATFNNTSTAGYAFAESTK